MMKQRMHPAGITICVLLIIAALQPARAENRAKPKAAPSPDLLAAFRTGPMAGGEEIIFAVRQPGKDGHWYANFGYYADSKSTQPLVTRCDEEGMRVTYGTGGRL